MKSLTFSYSILVLLVLEQLGNYIDRSDVFISNLFLLFQSMLFSNKEFSNGLNNHEGFSDIIVEPLTNQLTFADENFIVTQIGNSNKKILAISKQKEEELNDHEEGSGRIDFRAYEKLLNLTTNRVETASGRQDYNTIGIQKKR